MLVWLRSPFAIGLIPETGGRIYGYRLCYDPCEISYELYKRHKKIFKLAPYTTKWLRENYGADFTPIFFTYDEVMDMPYKALHRLAYEMNLGFRGNPSIKKLRLAIRRSLRSK